MRSNPGKTVTIFEIPSIVNDAHMVAMTPANVLAGFRSTGLFPYNRDLFTELDFAAAVVTDREMDVEANQGSTAEPNEDPNPNVEGHEGQQDSNGPDIEVVPPAVPSTSGTSQNTPLTAGNPTVFHSDQGFVAQSDISLFLKLGLGKRLLEAAGKAARRS